MKVYTLLSYEVGYGTSKEIEGVFTSIGLLEKYILENFRFKGLLECKSNYIFDDDGVEYYKPKGYIYKGNFEFVTKRNYENNPYHLSFYVNDVISE